MKIILISGKAESGKTMCADTLKKIMEQRGLRVAIVPFASYLKFICSKYFEWDGNKDERGRGILQKIGTDVVRKNNPDFWVDTFIEFAHTFKTEFDYIISDDVRFPNEILKIKMQFYSTMSVNISRPMHVNKLTAEQRQHESETALDYFSEHDVVIRLPEGIDEAKDRLISRLSQPELNWFWDYECPLTDLKKYSIVV